MQPLQLRLLPAQPAMGVGRGVCASVGTEGALTSKAAWSRSMDTNTISNSLPAARSASYVALSRGVNWRHGGHLSAQDGARSALRLSWDSRRRFVQPDRNHVRMSDFCCRCAVAAPLTSALRSRCPRACRSARWWASARSCPPCPCPTACPPAVQPSWPGAVQVQSWPALLLLLLLPAPPHLPWHGS